MEKIVKQVSKAESEELFLYINAWMTNHSAFDSKSTLIQIAIAEFVLNRQSKSLFAQNT
jgi:hypothetical protein